MEGKDNILSQNTRLKIAIFGNKYQEEYLTQLSEFFNLMSHYDLEVAMEYTFYNYLSRVLDTTPHVDQLIKGDRFTADIALSIGGDGTFLRTAQRVADKEIPIIGINTGHLGYLADVTIDECHDIFDDIINHRYKIEDRSLIEVSTSCPEFTGWKYALNEVAILKQDTASMISVETLINGSELATYRGDGLIVSTPTGSTGYNLSVGGPIIEPCAPNWALSPIAAHSLTMRPLVISVQRVLTITTTSRAQNYRISLDGRSTTLPVGTTVTLRKAPFVIKLAQRHIHHFTDTLRNKLLWGIDKI